MAGGSSAGVRFELPAESKEDKSERPTRPPPPIETLSWHAFDKASASWAKIPAEVRPKPSDPMSPATSHPRDPFRMSLVTWNIDGFGDQPEARMAGILSNLQQFVSGATTLPADPQRHAPDVIMLQEVSRDAMMHLLADSWIRDNYYTCETDPHNGMWLSLPFMTVTLLSRRSFDNDSLGPVWRIWYRSLYDRDALCCEVTPGPGGQRMCLVNVHLDSLANRPSLRPSQLGHVADAIRTVGRGVVAGDFNPVLPEDGELVERNGLEDVWMQLRPEEEGLTWGVGTVGRFPPKRMDKVAVLGMKGVEIKVLETGKVAGKGHYAWRPLAWSDHYGLKCTLTLVPTPASS